MAIFGEKFYKMLNELKPWQQSLFALTLAQRQSPNFLLYADVTENHEALRDFRNILNTMWEFHTDKENHISLEKLLETLEKHIPEIDDDSPYGAYPALDACISLSQSIISVTKPNMPAVHPYARWQSILNLLKRLNIRTRNCTTNSL